MPDKTATPFLDPETFPYPRLVVPQVRGASNYPRYSAGKIEYVVYEKEIQKISGKQYLVWREKHA